MRKAKAMGLLPAAILLFSCRVRLAASEPPTETLQSASPFPVGVAVAGDLLERNAAYRNIVLNEYGSITPENAAKIECLHPRQDTFDFSDLDRIVDFARAHQKRVHGVALIWHDTSGLGWLRDFRGDAAAWERVFKTHIQTVARRYQGRIRSWDVVNEAFNDDGTLRMDDETATDHRGSVWTRNLGKDYIARAFRYAHEADPEALLFYNDFELYDAGKPRKLEAVLAMVEDFKRRGVPIHGLGVQMHIGVSADEAAIAAALRRMAASGLMIHVSELDVLVSDWKKDLALVDTDELQARQAQKYRFIAETFKAAVPPAQRYGITVWNVGDADSWIPAAFGLKDWPLPFDAGYHKKKAYFGFLEGLRSASAGTPATKDYGLRDDIRVSRPLPRSDDKDWKLVCGLPYDCQFQPWIEVDAPAGRTIRFNSTNPLVLHLTPTAAGMRAYEARNWVSGTPLDKTSWTASASVPDGVFPFTDEKIPIDAGASIALEGDAWTGWRDLTATQHPGQWFQVDMREERSFRRIVLDNTWALWDSPRSYAVSVSGDGRNWSAPIATGAGRPGITEISFPPQRARFIRVTQTGTDPIPVVDL